MTNPELLGYVRTALSGGRSGEDCRKDLLSAGWKEEDIEGAMQFVAREMGRGVVGQSQNLSQTAQGSGGSTLGAFGKALGETALIFVAGVVLTFIFSGPGELGMWNKIIFIGFLIVFSPAIFATSFKRHRQKGGVTGVSTPKDVVPKVFRPRWRSIAIVVGLAVLIVIVGVFSIWMIGLLMAYIIATSTSTKEIIIRMTYSSVLVAVISYFTLCVLRNPGLFNC